jgi:uncharacterized protein (DUF2235 family)
VRKRLVVCCDGTWNTADQPSPTNVCKLRDAVRPGVLDDGVEQRVYYDAGVGTGRFDRVLGGAFGVGLSRNVKQAYMFLVEHFDPGDELFLFGFSRGAYTVRSVVGLARNVGILRRGLESKLDVAYELYRDRDRSTHPRGEEARLFRDSFSHDTRVACLGVWDTVGALGIPVDAPGLHLVNDYFKFHDVRLSTHVDHAFQALAIDEQRKPFAPALWEQQPEGRGRQTLEQVWFAGVHTDVGGGYPESGLSDITLRWMLARAAACGLGVSAPRLAPDFRAPLHDSMTWYYRAFGRFARPLGAPRVDERGVPLETHEAAADTAVARLGAVSGYGPVSLRRWVEAGGKQVSA